MKLAFVCPHFPPEVCGVGDYTSHVTAELVRTGHTMRVWTAQERPEPPAGVKVSKHPYPWASRTFTRITDEITAWEPDAVVVQFTPNLYGPRSWGLNPELPIFLARLRKKLNGPVLLTPHELHHPIGVKPDRLLLGTPQLAQFLSLAVIADLVLFTYEIPCRRYQRLLPWKRDHLFWLPVGGNVLPGPGYLRAPWAARSGQSKILIQFGSPHPSRLFDFSIAALDLANRHGDARLMMIGTTPETVRFELTQLGRLDLLPDVEGLGFLDAPGVSEWMARADLVLSPYFDGISARRSSAISALAHGTPVVTTRGYHTDPSIHWEELCALTAAKNTKDPRNAQAFAAKTLELLEAPDKAQALGEAGRARYESDFSHSVIARELIQILEGCIA